MIRTHKPHAGFTLVELTLAMAFLSMLLLAIALLTLQISSIYNKGLTTKAVNEAGQLVSSDIQRTLNTAVPTAVVLVEDTSPEPRGGRLCAGTTVYAWNYGKFLDDNDRFNDYDNTVSSDKLMRLVKFSAGGNNYCDETAGANGYLDVPSSATDLLSDGDVELAVHDFDVSKDAAGTSGWAVTGDATGTQRIYPVTIIIGTTEDSILNSIVDKSEGCQDRSTKARVDDEYCAVNKFEFTARAGNKEEKKENGN